MRKVTKANVHANEIAKAISGYCKVQSTAQHHRAVLYTCRGLAVGEIATESCPCFATVLVELLELYTGTVHISNAVQSSILRFIQILLFETRSDGLKPILRCRATAQSFTGFELSMISHCILIQSGSDTGRYLSGNVIMPTTYENKLTTKLTSHKLHPLKLNLRLRNPGLAPSLIRTGDSSAADCFQFRVTHECCSAYYLSPYQSQAHRTPLHCFYCTLSGLTFQTNHFTVS